MKIADLVAERWNICRIKNSTENEEDVIILVKWIYLKTNSSYYSLIVHIILTLMSLVEFILPYIYYIFYIIKLILNTKLIF